MNIMISKGLSIFLFLIVNSYVFAEGFPVRAPGIPKEFIMQFLPKNPIILEAGAFDGKDTVAMAKLWPYGKIYAFEPILRWFNKVKNRTKTFSHVTCYQLALSDKSEIAEFFLSSNAGASSSLLRPEKHLEYAPSVKFETSIMVNTITIDEWAKQEGIDHIDLLWLDIQGKEPDVLMASPHILKTVKAIYSEISREEIYKGQIVYRKYRRFLQSQGFREIYEDCTGPHGNVLFVRSDKNQIQLYQKK